MYELPDLFIGEQGRTSRRFTPLRDGKAEIIGYTYKER